ncbi:hypothetical protein GCM10022219_11550 [Microbacterium oryzae]|uniref:Uncharacterized protein n=1 Tax=Microbacterium oryzae TaxID=743009 RepID=A0A6I6E067_9MICO|nr:hypothetical protein [Microbacterium oryzae]QGU28473.1 hypothetical protein D7D94_12925 [Microbacterium oryzae]
MRSTSSTHTAEAVPGLGAAFVAPAADPRPTGVVAFLLEEIRRLQAENRTLRIEVDRWWLLAQKPDDRRDVVLARLDHAAEVVDSAEVDDHLFAAYREWISTLHDSPEAVRSGPQPGAQDRGPLRRAA